MSTYSILLGSIGDDAHSIGISLLKIGLEERGYEVTLLGIQNSLNDFIRLSDSHHIIFISCMNGHSNLYINEDTPNLNKISDSGRLWYLGGNLSVQKDVDDLIRFFLNCGFSRVFPKPIGLDEISHCLLADLDRMKINSDKRFERSSGTIRNEPEPYCFDEITDDPLKDEVFEAERASVLECWHTGKDVSYERAYRNYNKVNNMDEVLWNTYMRKETPLIQPRTGVADIEKQISLFQMLNRADINISSVQLDAASRRLYFEKAQEGVETSLMTGMSRLNGFPIPIHGVHGVERLVRSLQIPFQIRGGAPDHRFVYEVAIAGGASGVEGGFLCYLLPYEKRISPMESHRNWKYIDKLCGKYNALYGMNINREYFGPLTTALIEPSISITINIVQAVLSAKQGVKSISLGLAEQGNRSQDIASLYVLKKVSDYYLRKYGFTDVRTTTVFHQYMSAFPENENKAEQLITESAVTATLGGATRLMVKTPVEAFKIPSAEENIRGIMCVKKGIEKAKGVIPNQKAIQKEIKLLETEVSCLMRAIEELGNGHLSRGAIRALFAGIIDVPFSPNQYNRGEAITFRSAEGAVRFAQCINLPFPEHIKEFHYNELLNRKRQENSNKLYPILEKDLTRIWKGDYRWWPLDDCYTM